MELSQAILPVAGLGTRFLPWTKVVPKELLPIGNRPIIALLVDECLDAGITDICFVISKGKEGIPQYFYADPALEEELAKRGKSEALAELQRYDSVRFHVVYQEQQLGDGHAILQAADWVQSPHLAILFGDDLIAHDKSGLQQMIDMTGRIAAEELTEAAMLCLQNVPREKTYCYGIVETTGPADAGLHRITGLVEKPKPDDAPSTLGIVGKYIIPRSTFDVLPDIGASHGGEIRLIDALIERNTAGKPIYGTEFAGIRVDTGTPEGYKEAVKILG